jgi:hypothetical protein
MVFLPFLLKATESNPFSLYQKYKFIININFLSIHQKMLEMKNKQNFEREKLDVLKLENITFCYFFCILKTIKVVLF